MCDFESGLVHAVLECKKTCYDDVSGLALAEQQNAFCVEEVNNCLFHLYKSWRSYAENKCQLKLHLLENVTVWSWFKVLPYLPHHLIEAAFDDIVSKLPDCPKWQKFAAYLCEWYIRGRNNNGRPAFKPLH